MITSLEIFRFRGIREGKLDNLTPLVILVGPNGCGKSTVLDALLIGASDQQQANQALQYVLSRHTLERQRGLQQSIRWLFWRGELPASAIITTTSDVRESQAYELVGTVPNHIHCQLCEGSPPKQQVATPGRRSLGSARQENKAIDVRLLEGLGSSANLPLHHLVTESYRRGMRSEITQRIAEVDQRVKEVLILTEGDAPVVHLELPGYTVPAALAGDGIHSLLRICLELAASPDGLVLIEEPENHQHPGAIRQSARAMLSAVRRKTQLVLTTHSLELIDGLLAESSPEDIDRLSVYRLQLIDGKLVAVSVPGRDVAFARGQVEEDLR